MNWGDWGAFGDLLSGIGAIVVSVFAGVIASLLSFRQSRRELQQNRRQWVDYFRSLYAEFWDDSDISEVRRWISSRPQYDEILRPMLLSRNQFKENTLDAESNLKLDKVDKFISIIVRIQVAEELGLSSRERTLVTRLLFSNYWIIRVKHRSELVKYIRNHWKGELDI